MSSAIFYPTSPKEALEREYVGQSIRDVPTPAAVVNVAAVRRNCGRMLDACRSLGLGWRAHVKTHKTREITQFQVGEDLARPAKIIVSTLAEAEFVLPLLKGWRDQGREVNLLYGLPITKNAVSRLAAVAELLGPNGVSVLLDDPAQLPVAAEIRRVSGVAPLAHVKVDMGGRRAGVTVVEEEGGGGRFEEVVDAAFAAHAAGDVVLSGLYSHAGHSYGGDSRVAAIKMMRAEFDAVLQGADRIRARAAAKGVEVPVLTLSAGASPTALSVQNLLSSQGGDDVQDKHAGTPELLAEVTSLSELFATIKSRGHAAEIHAGVYPLLDLQQLAAHSLTASRLSWRDLALTVVAEVHGTYPGRGVGGTPEALIGAGGLALGREPCKAYGGMAMVTPWGREGGGAAVPTCDVEDYEGWMVGRFSQEHGILTWASGHGRAEKGGEGSAQTQLDEIAVGQKVRLWPNHACITSSHYGWYFVVDEDREGKEDEIVDVWIKARGW